MKIFAVQRGHMAYSAEYLCFLKIEEGKGGVKEIVEADGVGIMEDIK